MDASLIGQKLDSLRRCLARVQSRCPATAALLAQDIDAQDVIVLNLSRAVSLCTDIALHVLSTKDQPVPQTMGQAFEQLAALGLISGTTQLNLRKAVGFRNLAVHSYDQIDWDIVFAIAQSEVKDLKQFAVEIAAHLPEGTP